MAKLFFYPSDARSTIQSIKFLKKAGIEHELFEQESKIEIIGTEMFINQCQKEIELMVSDKEFTGKLERYDN